ncbi:MAG TPA: sulfite exporter TauE/SafE family protein [Vicinamibacterales bacterium]|nr:sulfite exporter TauE/SafE family protein [Vicinamibacterales bacterium]
MHPITGLLTALGALTAFYAGAWARTVLAIRRSGSTSSPAEDARVPTAPQVGIGFLTNFFDTLGIGSFATTTALFRLMRLVPDRIIPGTLNAGHTLPAITQAFIYTSVIPVDVLTLFAMIAAAVLGAWLGAGVVARWSRRKVQIGMGFALLGAAALMLMTQLNLFPAGDNALGVRGVRLAVGIGGNFALGALMTLGIGLYAPCMILVSLLGMNPTAAFPIMMGSCAFLMPVGSLRFIRERSYALRAALGLTLGGIPGVLLAAFIVKSLPLGAVRWLVIIVVLYTAVTMLVAANGARQPSAAEPAEA